MIHIYCGDGKGKTTAATGLAVRAAGSNRRVLFARFLKNECSCELKILDQIQDIHVIHLVKTAGFYYTLKEAEQKEVRRIYSKLWMEIKTEICQGSYQMLVLDEVMAACNYGIIEEEDVLRFLMQKPAGLEVVLTGRNPPESFVEIADYVSDIKKVKHPFDRNIGAREGIEY